MATKPTTSFTFATDANFTSGPYAGSATKQAPVGTEGFIPEDVVPAEVLNYMHNASGEWSGWLSAGSSTAITEAALVERDADGNTTILGVRCGGDAAELHVPLQVDSNSPAVNTVEIQHTGDGSPQGSIALRVRSNNDSSAIAHAVQVDNVSAGRAIDVWQRSAEDGIKIRKEVSGGSGLRVEVPDSITAFGASVVCLSNNNPAALLIAIGDGTTGADHGHCYMVPLAADAGLALEGELWTVKDSVGAPAYGETKMRIREAGGASSMWATPGGKRYLAERGTPSIALGTPQTIASWDMAAGYTGPGRYEVRAMVKLISGAGAPVQCIVQLDLEGSPVAPTMISTIPAGETQTYTLVQYFDYDGITSPMTASVVVTGNASIILDSFVATLDGAHRTAPAGP